MDKIRILWVDDKHSGGLPEANLPIEYENYYEIIDPRPTGGTYTSDYNFASVDEFLPVLDAFMKGYRNLMPCEILATDYELSKADMGSDEVKTTQAEKDELLKKLNDRKNGKESGVSSPIVSESLIQTNPVDAHSVNFDGLIINTIYSCITNEHPSALVSMTALMDKMPEGVKTLKKMAEPFVGVNFDQNLGGLDRSWENIIKTGVPHLRKRIHDLYVKGKIVLLPTELMVIYNLNALNDEVLTFKSPYVVRSLPLQGLFIDKAENERLGAVKEWVKELLESKITIEYLIEAQNLANQIWEVYNNDNLINDHAECSRLHAQNVSIERKNELIKKFGVENTKKGKSGNLKCTKNCIDIRDCTDKTVSRWAALFLIRKLLKRILNFIKNNPNATTSLHGAKGFADPYPIFSAADIYLLLFPVPKTPFPLPWHSNDGDPFNTWIKAMKDKLNFEPEYIINGTCPTDKERLILQGIVMAEDTEFGDTAGERLEYWKSYLPAKTFLFGSEKK